MCDYVYLSGDTYGRLNVSEGSDLTVRDYNTSAHKCQVPRVFPNPHKVPHKMSQFPLNT